MSMCRVCPFCGIRCYVDDLFMYVDTMSAPQSILISHEDRATVAWVPAVAFLPDVVIS